MLRLLLSKIPKLIRRYNYIDIVVTTVYIQPVKPVEYISIDFVIEKDIEAYKNLDKELEP